MTSDTPVHFPRKRAGVATALVLAAVQAVLLLLTAWDKSDVVDEPTYIVAAARLWKRHDFQWNSEAPVLPKWGFALALRLMDRLSSDPPSGVDPAAHLLWSRPVPELRHVLLGVRAATIAVTVAGGLFLWAAARRFGEGPALLTHVLWCFSPMVLASGSLAKLDAWAASLICALLFFTIRFTERPTLARAAVLGVALGLAAACKIPTLGALPVVLGVLLWTVCRNPPGSRLRRGLALGLAFGSAALTALWACYGFTIGQVDLRPLQAASGGRLDGDLGPLPFPSWTSGVVEQIAHGERGHRKYLFGRHSVQGFWAFYLAVIGLKTTLGVQVLAALRLAAALRRPTRWRVDLALLAFPVLLFLVMSAGNTQHEMYLLPAFGPVLVWLGRGLLDIRQAFSRPGEIAAWVLALFAAVGSLSVHPHHLMFFNVWAGGPEGGPRYLIVGDDSGQDQRRLAEWQDRNGIDVLYYTFYTGDPGAWGLRWQPPPCSAEADAEDERPRKGVYALQAVEVHRPRRIGAGCLDWLTVEPPDERIGYSIYIYVVDRTRLERLRANRNTPRPFWRSGG
jgi:hypothetical protein